MQYHSRIAFAVFSLMLMQPPWNHSLQLSQPLGEENVWANLKASIFSNWKDNKNGWVTLHHEAVDVWFPADTVQRCVLPIHTAGFRPRWRFNIGHLTVLESDVWHASQRILLHIALNGILLQQLLIQFKILKSQIISIHSNKYNNGDRKLPVLAASVYLFCLHTNLCAKVSLAVIADQKDQNVVKPIILNSKGLNDVT